MDLEEAVALRKVEREMTTPEKQEKERRRRLVDNARQLCEYGAWIRGELRQKERGSL